MKKKVEWLSTFTIRKELKERYDYDVSINTIKNWMKREDEDSRLKGVLVSGTRWRVMRKDFEEFILFSFME